MTVGQSLTLQCRVTTVTGISSTMNIIWSSCGKTLSNTTIRGGSTVNRNSYTIRQLSTTDEGKVYQCEVVINTNPPVMATGNTTLHVTGNYI